MTSTVSPIQWSKTYGGSGDDYPFNVAELSDGTLAIVGYTKSNDGEVTDNHCSSWAIRGVGGSLHCGLEDAWIVKITKDGNRVSQHVYGGAPERYVGYGNDRDWPSNYYNSDRVTALVSTPDGGFLAAGQTNSLVNYSTDRKAPSYNWLIKVDKDGNAQGPNILIKKTSTVNPQNANINDSISCVIQSADLNYYVYAGVTDEGSGDKTGLNATLNNLNLDGTGNLKWGLILGGSGDDKFNSVILTADKFYVAVGQTSSSFVNGLNGNGTAPVYSIKHGGMDLWVCKISQGGYTTGFSGNVVLGGESTDIANSIIETKDHEFIVVGQTNSVTGDALGNHSNNYDAWVIKLDASLKVVWKKTYGGTFGDDMATSVVQTDDGNFVVAGQTSSNDGDVTGNHGYSDVWVFKIDKDGKMLWQETLGGSGADEANRIIKTSDGKLLLACSSSSNNGDVSNSRGSSDFWLVKINDR